MWEPCKRKGVPSGSQWCHGLGNTLDATAVDLASSLPYGDHLILTHSIMMDEIGVRETAYLQGSDGGLPLDTHVENGTKDYNEKYV